MQNTYCLISKELSAAKLMDFYTNALHLLEKEAREKLQNNSIFILENATFDKARNLQITAEKRGIKTIFLAMKEIPKLPAGIVCRRIDFSDIFFEYSTQTIKEKIFYEHITFISACFIKKERILPETMMEEFNEKLKKILFPNTHKNIPPKKTYEMFMCMDIFFGVSPFRIRVNSKNFNFSCLGKEKTYSSIHNCEKLLRKFSELALKARLSPSASGLIEKNRDLHFVYKNSAAYEKEIAAAFVLSNAPPYTQES